MEWWGIVLLVAAAVLAILFGLVYKMFSSMCCRHVPAKNADESFFRYISTSASSDWVPKIQEGIHWIEETAHEDVFIRSFDGLRLHARLYENPNWNGRVLILCHGFHSDPRYDFSCACKFYFQHGYTILLIDQRSHGESEGKYICFGDRERYDARDWCRFVNTRYGEHVPLLLSGVSMGSTTALLTAGLPDAPQNLIGVIADCGYVNTYEEFRFVLNNRFRLPAFPLLPMAELLCRVCGGFGLRSCSVLDAVQHIRVPVLFVHGEADDLVPSVNTEQAYAACTARKKIMLIPGAAHGLSWLIANKQYTDTLLLFLESLE